MSILGDAIIAGVASTGPKPELNKNKWSVINEVALAGTGPNYWSVGDTKEVTLNGSVGYGSSQATFSNTKYWVYIIGFDHNSAKEGTGIAFQGFKTAQSGGVDIAIVTSNYGSTGSGMVMNASNTNSGGWTGSVAYKTIMPQWKSCFPSELQDVIKSTTLYTDNTGGGSTSASAVTANSNEVYYLAEYEVFGAHSYANTNEAAQQQQYAYYKAGNSKIKYRSDSTSNAAIWWLRSRYPNGSDSFCFVSSAGDAYNITAHYSCGAAPAFKVGNPPPLTGEWVFNSVLSNYTTVPTVSMNFTSENIQWTQIGYYTGDDIFSYADNSGWYGVYDGTWTNTAYRTINITTPFYRNTNPTFYDWFVANAVKQEPVGGIWQFKPSGEIDIVGFPNYDSGNTFEQYVDFMCDGTAYSRIGLMKMPNAIVYMTDSTPNLVVSSGIWAADKYRTIEFADDQYVSPDFYNWFMANATII